MKSRLRHIIALDLIALLITIWGTAMVAHAAPPSRRPGSADYAGKENTGRTVDEIAMTTKQRAIQTLMPLLQARQGTAEESQLMARVMELQYDIADIEFRIANGKAIQRKANPDLTAYKSYLRTGAEMAGAFIRKFPNDPKIPRVYYLRARGLGEIGNKEEAIADLRTFVDKYSSNLKEAHVATLGLADMLIEKKDYPTAIFYLNKLIRDPSTSSYTLALDRLAWVEFYLNDVPAALVYLGYEIRYYRERPSRDAQSMYQKEKVLDATTLFYATAMEQKKPGYDAVSGFKSFQTIASGPELEKMLIKFAYLLRAKALDNELDALKGAVLAEQPANVDTLELTAVVFENQLNKHRFAQLNQTSRELYSILDGYEPGTKSPRQGKVIKILSDAAADLQASFAKNKNDGEARPIAVSLTTLYDLLLKINAADEPGSAKIHYNLAEIFFHFRDYPTSTSHYRWVAEHAAATWPDKMKKVAEDAKLKAIGSRYEAFRAQKIFPDDIKAKSLAENTADPVPQEIAEWIKWMDDYAAANGLGPNIDTFIFEGNRLIYSKAFIKLAVDRLNKFIAAAPKSPLAIPSATLIMDTYIATQNWDDTYTVALEMLKRREWEGSDFHAKLGEIAGDAYFKRVEALYKKQQYPEALKEADNFLRLYPKSHFRPDAMSLGASAALAINDKPLAMQYFGALKREKHLTGELTGNAHLTAAAVAEEKYDLVGAANEYSAYIMLPEIAGKKEHEADRLEKRKRILLLAWISGDPGLLGRVLKDNHICSGTLFAQCEQFKLMQELEAGRRVKWWVAKGREQDELWWVAGLSGDRPYSMNLKLEILDQIATNWGKQDPVLSYSLMQHLVAVLPRVLSQMRHEVRKDTPIKLDKQHIANRAGLIDKVEQISAKIVANIPFSRIKVTALNEVASLYMDFSEDLQSIPPPKGLTAEDAKTYHATVAELKSPFETKGLQMRQKALLMASDAGVDAAVFNDIVVVAFKENSELKASFGKSHPSDGGRAARLEISRLTDLITNVPKEKKSPMRDGFATAVHGHHLPKAVYLLQEAEKKAAFDTGELHVARAIVFDMAGARAEALAELDQSKDLLDGGKKAFVLSPLVSAFYETYAFDKTQNYLKELLDQNADRIKDSVMNRSGANLTAAAQWTGTKVPEELSLYFDVASMQSRQPAGRDER